MIIIYFDYCVLKLKGIHLHTKGTSSTKPGRNRIGLELQKYILFQLLQLI